MITKVLYATPISESLKYFDQQYLTYNFYKAVVTSEIRCFKEDYGASVHSQSVGS